MSIRHTRSPLNRAALVVLAAVIAATTAAAQPTDGPFREGNVVQPGDPGNDLGIIWFPIQEVGPNGQRLPAPPPKTYYRSELTGNIVPAYHTDPPYDENDTDSRLVEAGALKRSKNRQFLDETNFLAQQIVERDGELERLRDWQRSLTRRGAIEFGAVVTQVGTIAKELDDAIYESLTEIVESQARHEALTSMYHRVKDQFVQVDPAELEDLDPAVREAVLDQRDGRRAVLRMREQELQNIEAHTELLAQYDWELEKALGIDLLSLGLGKLGGKISEAVHSARSGGTQAGTRAAANEAVNEGRAALSGAAEEIVEADARQAGASAAADAMQRAGQRLETTTARLGESEAALETTERALEAAEARAANANQLLEEARAAHELARSGGGEVVEETVERALAGTSSAEGQQLRSAVEEAGQALAEGRLSAVTERVADAEYFANEAAGQVSELGSRALHARAQEVGSLVKQLRDFVRSAGPEEAGAAREALRRAESAHAALKRAASQAEEIVDSARHTAQEIMEAHTGQELRSAQQAASDAAQELAEAQAAHTEQVGRAITAGVEFRRATQQAIGAARGAADEAVRAGSAAAENLVGAARGLSEARASLQAARVNTGQALGARSEALRAAEVAALEAEGRVQAAAMELARATTQLRRAWTELVRLRAWTELKDFAIASGMSAFVAGDVAQDEKALIDHYANALSGYIASLFADEELAAVLDELPPEVQAELAPARAAVAQDDLVETPRDAGREAGPDDAAGSSEDPRLGRAEPDDTDERIGPPGLESHRDDDPYAEVILPPVYTGGAGDAGADSQEEVPPPARTAEEQPDVPETGVDEPEDETPSQPRPPRRVSQMPVEPGGSDPQLALVVGGVVFAEAVAPISFSIEQGALPVTQVTAPPSPPTSLVHAATPARRDDRAALLQAIGGIMQRYPTQPGGNVVIPVQTGEPERSAPAPSDDFFERDRERRDRERRPRESGADRPAGGAPMQPVPGGAPGGPVEAGAVELGSGPDVPGRVQLGDGPEVPQFEPIPLPGRDPGGLVRVFPEAAPRTGPGGPGNVSVRRGRGPAFGSDPIVVPGANTSRQLDRLFLRR